MNDEIFDNLLDRLIYMATDRASAEAQRDDLQNMVYDLQAQVTNLKRADPHMDFKCFQNTVNDMLRALGAGQKINAIKLYRSVFNVGLKEAKDAIEDNFTNL